MGFGAASVRHCRICNAHGFGRLLATSSVAGTVSAWPQHAHYTAAKAGTRGPRSNLGRGVRGQRNHRQRHCPGRYPDASGARSRQFAGTGGRRCRGRQEISGRTGRHPGRHRLCLPVPCECGGILRERFSFLSSTVPAASRVWTDIPALQRGESRHETQSTVLPPDGYRRRAGPATRAGRIWRASAARALAEPVPRSPCRSWSTTRKGSEKTFAMGDQVNDGMYELPFAVDDQRDLAVESMYEYGSRAGIWRMFRIFDAAGIPGHLLRRRRGARAQSRRWPRNWRPAATRWPATAIAGATTTK